MKKMQPIDYVDLNFEVCVTFIGDTVRNKWSRTRQCRIDHCFEGGTV